MSKPTIKIELPESKKILPLTLKKKWFDMILSGEKKEEYREVKEYWKKRLCKRFYNDPSAIVDGAFVDFDIIRFTNGYSRHAPTFDIECKGITIDFGMMSWGAPQGQYVFILSLGNIISKNHIN